jgi:flagellar protein FlaI
VDEIVDYDNYRNIFKWKPMRDSFNSSVEKSTIIPSISRHSGFTREELLEEIRRRKNVLSWMRKHNIRSYKDVAAIITEYYSRPKEFYAKKVEKFVSN